MATQLGSHSDSSADGLPTAAATTVETTTASVETTTTTAMKTTAASETAATMESATTTSEAVACITAAVATAISAAVATAISTAVAATISVAAAISRIAIPAAISIATAEPRARADKDPAVKPLRAVIAVRSAGVRRVIVVAVGAYRRGITAVSVCGADADTHRNLSMGSCGKQKQTNCDQTEQEEFTHRTPPKAAGYLGPPQAPGRNARPRLI